MLCGMDSVGFSVMFSSTNYCIDCALECWIRKLNSLIVILTSMQSIEGQHPLVHGVMAFQNKCPHVVVNYSSLVLLSFIFTYKYELLSYCSVVTRSCL